MRRLISYSILSGIILLSMGVGAVPLIEKINTDIAYSDGKTLYFRACHEDPESVTGNYGDEDGAFLIDSDRDTKGQRIIDDIADTMRERLDSWTSSEYHLETIGTDTIAVTLRSQNHTDQQYAYLQRYLTFSGQDYELDAENTTYDDYPADDKWRDIIDGSEARIENYTLGTGVELPTVVIPLKEGEAYQTAFRNLLTYCSANTHEAEKDDEGNETTPASSCQIVIWANRKETDLYSNASTDSNVSSRVLTTVDPTTAKYVPDSDAEKEENEQTLSLRLVPQSAAFEGGQYNPDKGALAYEAANFYLHMINASRYAYDVTATNKANFVVNYLYSAKAAASVENLVKLGDWYMAPALSRTLIATLIAVVLLAAGLIAKDRLSGLAGIIASLGTGFVSFAFFFLFGAQFNVAALIGLACTVLLGLFGYLYQQSRLKIELYRGRTLKKANAEAAKKAVWPIVDAGIAAVIIGAFLYGFGGAVASKAGVMVAIGGVVSILVNLIVTRFLMWELANDDTAAARFPSYYKVRKDRIPDPLKDEKQSYFGSFADTDFKKRRKIGLIAGALLLLASVGSMIAWGTINGGNVYNDTTSGVTTSLIQLDVLSKESNKIMGTTAEKISDESKLRGTDPVTGSPRLLEAIKIDDKTLSSYVTSIELCKTPKAVYHTPEAGEGYNDYWFYYTIELKQALSTEEGAYAITVWDGANYVAADDQSLGVALETLTNSLYITEATDFRISVDAVKLDAAQPYLWQIALGLGVGIAVSTVYFMLRFRPGKGLALGLTTAAVTFAAVGFFALTRIPVSSVVSLGAVIAMVGTMLVGLFLLNSDKEIHKESKEKEKNTFEFRRDSLDTATRYDAHNLLFIGIVASYTTIVYFGFGPYAFHTAFAAGLLGVLVGTLFFLFGYSFLAESFMKLFGLIKFRRNPSKKKKKKVAGQLMKKKGAEPEESIFIGIND